MKTIFKIEITLSPSNTINPQKPYFWILWSNNGNNWCNSNCGWSESPSAAWTSAYEFYTLYKSKDSTIL